MDLRSLGKRVESNIGFGSVGNSTTQNWSRTASSTGTAKVLVGRDITLHQNVIFSGVAVTVDIDGQRVVCTIDGEGSNRSLFGVFVAMGSACVERTVMMERAGAKEAGDIQTIDCIKRRALAARSRGFFVLFLFLVFARTVATRRRRLFIVVAVRGRVMVTMRRGRIAFTVRRRTVAMFIFTILAVKVATRASWTVGF